KFPAARGRRGWEARRVSGSGANGRGNTLVWVMAQYYTPVAIRSLGTLQRLATASGPSGDPGGEKGTRDERKRRERTRREAGRLLRLCRRRPGGRRRARGVRRAHEGAPRHDRGRRQRSVQTAAARVDRGARGHALTQGAREPWPHAREPGGSRPVVLVDCASRARHLRRVEPEPAARDPTGAKRAPRLPAGPP